MVLGKIKELKRFLVPRMPNPNPSPDPSPKSNPNPKQQQQLGMGGTARTHDAITAEPRPRLVSECGSGLGEGGRVGALAHAAFARGPDATLIRGGLGGGEGREREGGCEERERERETEREH